MVKCMKRVWICGIVVAALACASVAAAELPASYISWSADRPLTWGDFWTSAPAWAVQGNWVASPHLVINWSASFKAVRTGTVWTASVTSLTVTNAVDRSLSWAISSRTSPTALHHEQLHFNLHEVYRRLLEMTLGPMTSQASSEAACQSLNDQLKSVSAQILQRAQNAQLQFDRDTANGTNLEAQAIWETQIASLLLNPAAAP
jgi:hypothetical protein